MGERRNENLYDGVVVLCDDVRKPNFFAVYSGGQMEALVPNIEINSLSEVRLEVNQVSNRVTISTHSSEDPDDENKQFVVPLVPIPEHSELNTASTSHYTAPTGFEYGRNTPAAAGADDAMPRYQNEADVIIDGINVPQALHAILTHLGTNSYLLDESSLNSEQSTSDAAGAEATAVPEEFEEYADSIAVDYDELAPVICAVLGCLSTIATYTDDIIVYNELMEACGRGDLAIVNMGLLAPILDDVAPNDMGLLAPMFDDLTPNQRGLLVHVFDDLAPDHRGLLPTIPESVEQGTDCPDFSLNQNEANNSNDLEDVIGAFFFFIRALLAVFTLIRAGFFEGFGSSLESEEPTLRTKEPEESLVVSEPTTMGLSSVLEREEQPPRMQELVPPSRVIEQVDEAPRAPRPDRQSRRWRLPLWLLSSSRNSRERSPRELDRKGC